MTESSVSSAEYLVRINSDGIYPCIGNLIGPCRRIAGSPGDIYRIVCIGSCIPEHFQFLSYNFSVLFDTCFYPVGKSASAWQKVKFFFSCGLKFYRSSPCRTGKRGHQRLKVNSGLSSETSSNVRNNNSYFIMRNFKGITEKVSYGKGRLSACPYSNSVFLFPLCYCHMGFHGDMLNGGVGILSFNNEVCLFKSLFYISLSYFLVVNYIGSRLR